MHFGGRAFFIGPNASGKSNILDALRFLRDVAGEGLQGAVARRGGMSEIRSEAWFLADSEGIARFLRVAKDSVPFAPEDEPDPKSRIIALARRSRSRAIREGLVPVAGDRRRVGPEYALMVGEFARDHWSPERAANRAPSLRRTIERCRRFARDGQWH